MKGKMVWKMYLSLFLLLLSREMLQSLDSGQGSLVACCGEDRDEETEPCFQGAPRRARRSSLEQWESLVPTMLLTRSRCPSNKVHTHSSHNKPVRLVLAFFFENHILWERKLKPRGVKVNCSRKMDQKSFSRVHVLHPNSDQLWVDPRQGYANIVRPIQLHIST